MNIAKLRTKYHELPWRGRHAEESRIQMRCLPWCRRHVRCSGFVIAIDQHQKTLSWNIMMLRLEGSGIIDLNCIMLGQAFSDNVDSLEINQFQNPSGKYQNTKSTWLRHFGIYISFGWREWVTWLKNESSGWRTCIIWLKSLTHLLETYWGSVNARI